MAAWWVAVHALAIAAFLLLGAPWLAKGLAILIVVVHAIAHAPPRTPRLVYRSDGRMAVPQLGLDELTLGPRTRYTTGWVRFDLRGADRALDILLLADQIEPALWRSLQAHLRRMRPTEGNAALSK